MGLRDLFRTKSATAAVARVPSRTDGFLGNLPFEWVTNNEHESERGEPLYGQGAMFGGDGDAVHWDDDRFEAAGALLFKIAGVSFRPDVLVSGCCDVGSRVQLVPEPTNEHDANAIAVFDATGATQIGYVPRVMTDTVRRLGTDQSSGVIFFEWRLQHGERCALRCATGPPQFVGRLARYIADQQP